MRIPSVVQAFLLVTLFCVPAAAQVPPDTGPVTAAGDGAVRGELLPHGSARFRLVAEATGDTMEIGTLTQTITRARDGGRPLLRVVQTLVGRSGMSTDTTHADAATLAPVTLRGHNPDRTMMLDFDGTRVTGSYEDEEGSAHAIGQTVSHPVFDATVIDLVIAALPLEGGFRARLPVYVYERGGLVWNTVTVGGETDASGQAAWVVDVTVSNAGIRYVIGQSPRRVLSMTVIYDNGMVLRMTRLPD